MHGNSTGISREFIPKDGTEACSIFEASRRAASGGCERREHECAILSGGSVAKVSRHGDDDGDDTRHYRGAHNSLSYLPEAPLRRCIAVHRCTADESRDVRASYIRPCVECDDN